MPAPASLTSMRAPPPRRRHRQRHRRAAMLAGVVDRGSSSRSSSSGCARGSDASAHPPPAPRAARSGLRGDLARWRRDRLVERQPRRAHVVEGCRSACRRPRCCARWPRASGPRRNRPASPAARRMRARGWCRSCRDAGQQQRALALVALVALQQFVVGSADSISATLEAKRGRWRRHRWLCGRWLCSCSSASAAAREDPAHRHQDQRADQHRQQRTPGPARQQRGIGHASTRCCSPSPADLQASTGASQAAGDRASVEAQAVASSSSASARRGAASGGRQPCAGRDSLRSGTLRRHGRRARQYAAA